MNEHTTIQEKGSLQVILMTFKDLHIHVQVGCCVLCLGGGGGGGMCGSFVGYSVS
jgi:hypothetical protein